MDEKEPTELIAAALTKVRERGWQLIGRNSIPGKVVEWFVDSPMLPAGEFMAGPFGSREEAAQAADGLTAVSVIAVLAEAGYVLARGS